jgi:ankyrin repeat protein
MQCDQLALLYIEQGARVDHRGCHGGTALHWAAWCGRDLVVEKLVKLVPNINQLCIDFKSTPLFWSIHGYRFGKDNRHHQIDCARILLAHGADPSIPNFEGYLPVQLVEGSDKEWLRLFHK